MIRVRSVLGAGLAVALIATGVVVLTSTSNATTPFSVPRGTIQSDYFVKNFNLAGVVRVTPASDLQSPTRNEPTVARQIWSTSQLDGFTPEGLGYGDVTVTRSVGGTSREQREPAWVGLAYFNPRSYQCPVQTKSLRAAPSEPRAAGWVAVVVGDRSNAPAVLVAAPSVVCGHLRLATLFPATDMVSVPWSEAPSSTSSDEVATVPECATLDGVGYGGSPTSSTGVVYVTIPEAENRSRCSGTRTVAIEPSELGGASSSTVHARLGLVRQAQVTPAFPAVPPECRASGIRTSVAVRRDQLAHGAGFLATVDFVNHSSSCWLVSGIAFIRAYRGAAHVGVGPSSASPSLFRPKWLVLHHGSVAWSTIGESSTHCTVAVANGFALQSYQSGWPTQYLGLSPALRICAGGAENFTVRRVTLARSRRQ